MLQEIQRRQQQNGQTNSESNVNEGASCSDEFETAEVIFCPDHETERLDRVCMKCKKIICVLCEEDTSHEDHEVKLLGNKGCIKGLEEHFQDDLITVHQKLDHLQETLDKISESESDAYNEFRQLEDTVVHTIREVFLRKERDFLERLRGKKTVLMTQREVVKASVNEMPSLVSRITSGRCSLSSLYQTLSRQNSLSSLASGVENRIGDHDDSEFGQKLEQELRDAIVECQRSLQNVVFSRKRKIEAKEDAMSPERMGEPPKRKSMDTSSGPKYNSEFEGHNSLTQSQENSSLNRDFEEEEAEAQLSMEFPNKDLEAADCFIMLRDDEEDSVMENPDPCSAAQVERSSCYSTACAGRSENEPKLSQISGNISNNAVNFDVIDAEIQSNSVEYPLMTQLKDITEKEVTKITTANLIQRSGDQNTEKNAKLNDMNSTLLAVKPCDVVQTTIPQVESKSCTKSKRVFSCNLVFDDDNSDVDSEAFPSNHEDNPTSSTVPMSWAGENNTTAINGGGKKNLIIRIDESSDVNSRTFPSDHDDDTSSTVTMSWAEDEDSTFKAPPLIYRNGKKSLRNVVEKGSFTGNQVSGDECSCSTTTNDDATWGTSGDELSCDPTLPSSHTLQLNLSQFHEPDELAVGPSSTIYVDEDSDVNSRSFPRDHDNDTTSSTVTTSCTDDSDSTVMYREPSKVREAPFLRNQVAVGECSCSTTNDNSAAGTSEDLPTDPTLPPNEVDSPQPHFHQLFSHSPSSPPSSPPPPPPPPPPPGQEFPDVMKFITTLGSKGRKSDQFNEPEGLAVDANGNIFVADSLNNRIQVFNSDLEFVISIGTTRPGLLSKPFDVTVCLSNANRDVSEVNRNAVIVADKFHNKLQLFWGDGKFAEKFGMKGRKPQQFEAPSCVTVNSKGHVIVTDTCNHRIQVIKPNGEDNMVFGSKGGGFGDFCDPVGVAVDGNDNIIVADYGNNRMKMLSLTGETLRTFGEGELSKPSHVAVSPRGNIFVSDSENHRIQIYDKDGKYVASFGAMGTEAGLFQQPGGIAWLTNGRLLVSDVLNCRLQIFDCPY